MATRTKDRDTSKRNKRKSSATSVKRNGDMFDMGPERRVINAEEERERERKRKRKQERENEEARSRKPKSSKARRYLNGERKTAVLDYRLFVPKQFVTEKMKDAFTGIIPDALDPIDEFGEPREDTNVYVCGYKYHKKEKLYSFARGDRDKIDDVFADFRIDDCTAAPQLKHRITFKGVSVDGEYLPLRPEQIRVIKKVRKRGYGILVAPPRFGKTTVMTRIITKYQLRTILFVHQIDLARQFLNEFRSCTDVTEIERRTGRKIIGIARDWADVATFEICIVTWQKFHSGTGGKEAIGRFRDRFGLTLVDEVHVFSSQFSSKVIGSFNTRYRIGVTATPERKDQRDVIVKQIIGDVVAEGETKQVPLRVRPVYTGFRFEDEQNGQAKSRFGGGQSDFPRKLTQLGKDVQRNNLIVHNVLKDVEAKRSVLVVTERTGHIEELVERLKKHGVKAAPFHGSLKKDRESTLLRAKSGETQVLVAMGRMMTGVNVPRWASMHLTMPSSNKPTSYQVFSRVRTPFPGKSVCYVNDYIDASPIGTGCYRHRHSNYVNKKYAPVAFVDDNLNVIKTPSFEKIEAAAKSAEKPKFRDGKVLKSKNKDAKPLPSIPRTPNAVWGWGGGEDTKASAKQARALGFVSSFNDMKLSGKKKKKKRDQ